MSGAARPARFNNFCEHGLGCEIYSTRRPTIDDRQTHPARGRSEEKIRADHVSAAELPNRLQGARAALPTAGRRPSAGTVRLGHHETRICGRAQPDPAIEKTRRRCCVRGSPGVGLRGGQCPVRGRTAGTVHTKLGDETWGQEANGESNRRTRSRKSNGHQRRRLPRAKSSPRRRRPQKSPVA